MTSKSKHEIQLENRIFIEMHNVQPFCICLKLSAQQVKEHVTRLMVGVEQGEETIPVSVIIVHPEVSRYVGVQQHPVLPRHSHQTVGV